MKLKVCMYLYKKRNCELETAVPKCGFQLVLFSGVGGGGGGGSE